MRWGKACRPLALTYPWCRQTSPFWGGDIRHGLWLANCYFLSHRACNIVIFCRLVSAGLASNDAAETVLAVRIDLQPS
jgi:hypothetical protein